MLRASLKKGKEEFNKSLKLTQAEVEGLKEQASVTAAKPKATTDKIVTLDELECSSLSVQLPPPL